MPKNPKPSEDQLAATEAALEGFDPQAIKAKKQPPTPRPVSEVHTTIPLDKSLEALKAHKRRKPKIQKEGKTKNESQDHGSSNGSGGPNPSDAGKPGGLKRKWGLVLPIDYFRRGTSED